MTCHNCTKRDVCLRITYRDVEFTGCLNLELNMIGFLSVPGGKNIMCWYRHVFGSYVEN